jgi:hypothetical protein
MDKKLCFSFITGQIFEINEDEVGALDTNQILLVSRPSSNCKKCYGRFHVGKNTKNGYYLICKKCAIKCLDFDYMNEKFLQKSAESAISSDK